MIQLLQEKQSTVSRIVSYFDRKYDFKSERKSDKSEIDFSVRGRLFQFEIVEEIRVFQRHKREIVVIISCASGALVRDRGKRVSKRGWEFVVCVISSKNRLI